MSLGLTWVGRFWACGGPMRYSGVQGGEDLFVTHLFKYCHH